MARFVIDGLMYDTKKMQRVGKVKKWYRCGGAYFDMLFGGEFGKMYDCDLYRSKNGRYLLMYKDDKGYERGQAIDEDEVKKLLARDDIDAYIKLFGEIEEA